MVGILLVLYVCTDSALLSLLSSMRCCYHLLLFCISQYID